MGIKNGIVASTGPIGALSDVDTTTLVPASGDALVFDGANWVPGFNGTASLWTNNLADDTAWSFDFGAEIFNGFLSLVSNAGPEYALIAFRAAASGNFCTVIAGTGVNGTTGELTGTTGADGVTTVSVGNGIIYVENREGSIRHYAVTVNSHWIKP